MKKNFFFSAFLVACDSLALSVVDVNKTVKARQQEIEKLKAGVT